MFRTCGTVNGRVFRRLHRRMLHCVLQDVHWSSGMIGYFPTYALGNLCLPNSGEGNQEIPDLDEQFRVGKFESLAWLAAREYPSPRSQFEPQELMLKITGSKIDPSLCPLSDEEISDITVCN